MVYCKVNRAWPKSIVDGASPGPNPISRPSPTVNRPPNIIPVVVLVVVVSSSTPIITVITTPGQLRFYLKLFFNHPVWDKVP